MNTTHEELVLAALQRVLRLPEREADEESRDDVQRDLRHKVRRVAPVRLAVALPQQRHLVEPRRRELVVQLRRHGRAAPALGVDRLDLVLEAHGLGRLLPDVVPVGRRNRSGTGADGGENVLSPAAQNKRQKCIQRLILGGDSRVLVLAAARGCYFYLSSKGGVCMCYTTWCG